MRSLARMVSSDCVMIWPVTGVFGASAFGGVCCAAAPAIPSASAKAVALIPVLNDMVVLHVWLRMVLRWTLQLKRLNARRGLWLPCSAHRNAFEPPPPQYSPRTVQHRRAWIEGAPGALWS